ncbi:hypothetical protein QBC34DRAFT_311031 [Podospora aff. communis PSN243]|uniref:Heterokaryon incompatibility domain-containing protein n=1 Tax=Podospora aff. communis PSN243 TaxID=3040156 RepID=A0AAV9G563_9PEZI|nr:hypothetical protein QBC34DRAFT_311031 [Podospora aff. communis PSN243]
MAQNLDDVNLDVAKAQGLIAEIRERHTSVVHEELETIVDDLLHILSSELYDVSTHCILELLQNADDNHYTLTPDEPTLELTFDGQHLRVDCNEDGFEANHVRAISTVRRSTKSGKKHAFGYTGEKGIGFKSVFRIADRVWVSSRQFQFMFDKNEKFGIIAPMSQSFPPPHRPSPDQTSFLLELSDGRHKLELVQALDEFDPVLLLFLRTLTRVVLRIQMSDHGSEWVKTILKIITIIDHSASITTIRHSDEFQERHFVFNHDIGDLPLEARRQGCTTSRLTLAFPVTGLPEKPSVTKQHVFSLLPICDHGLKFKLNGDFVLSASRLNIDESLAWNQRLRDGLVDAFIEAVQTFNKLDGTMIMRYIWPFYVPDNTSSFFRDAQERILETLAECPMLESLAGSMLTPSQLVYVDPKYRYAFLNDENNSQPFTLSSKTASKYLSTRYPPWTTDSIIKLGVLELTDVSFLKDLEVMIAADPKDFQTRTADWHQELASVLLPLSRTDALRPLLKRLPIIPLSNGTWVSSSQNPVFTSSSLKLSRLPSSISLPLVASSASANTSRRLLYQSLGVQEISGARMCRYIVDAHNSASFKPEDIKRVDLISYATYLFKSSWQPPEDANIDLWFATTDDGRCKGSQLYIRGDYKPDSATARIFDKLRQKYPTIRDNYFLGPVSSDAVKLAEKSDCTVATYRGQAHWPQVLHPSYLLDPSMEAPSSSRAPPVAQKSTSISTEGDQYVGSPSWMRNFWRRLTKKGDRREVDSFSPDGFAAWRTYMIKTLHLSEIPRLVKFPDKSCRQNYHLSDEFKFLFQACPPSDVLHLLNEHWTSYAEWLEPSGTALKDSVVLESNKRLLEELGGCKVPTCYGIHELRDSVLPNLDADLDGFNMPTPVLEMPDSEDKTLRRRLSIFGIKVDNDVEYYLACLRALRKQKYYPEYDAISYLYEQIQARYSGKEDEVNKVFESNAYVYLGKWLPDGSRPGSWVTIDHCTKSRLDAGALYPSCSTFFHGLLGSDGRKIEPLIAAAALIDSSWKLAEISKHLIKISTGLRNATSARARLWLLPLRKLAIFPTRSSQEVKTYDRLVSVEDCAWFIADQRRFNRAFQGIVPLLAFSTTEIVRLGPLLVRLGLQSRKLSLAAVEKTFPSGRPTYSERDTQFFRNRTLYITMLIPDSHPSQSSFESQLDSARVYTASSISQRYTIQSSHPDAAEYEGRLAKRDVAIRASADEMQVFLADIGVPLSKRDRLPLVEAIAAHCDITDELSRRLLYTALCETELQIVDDYFRAAGHEFEHDTDSDESDESGSGEDSEAATDSNSGQRRVIRGYGTGYKSETHERRVPARPSGHSGSVPLASRTYEDDYGLSRSHNPEALRGGVRTHVPHLNLDTKQQDLKPDRRLPFVHNGPAGEGNLGPELQKSSGVPDPNHHLEYLGESLVSVMFQSQGVDAYDPLTHWTSDLRVRAGLSSLPPGFRVKGDVSPFTFSDPCGSKAISDLLRRLDLINGDDEWDNWRPTYHIEVAVSMGDWDSPFACSLAKLRRIQQRQMGEPARGHIKDIVLLVHISNPYSEPRFHITVDPWSLLVSNRMILQGEVDFQIVIKPPPVELSSAGQSLHYQLPPEPKIPNLVVPRIRPSPGHLGNGALIFPPSKADDASRSYLYTCLGQSEFRLFMLFPGKENDTLRGAVFTCALNGSIPPFQALSYEWGPERQGRRTVMTESGRLVIRESLCKALRAIRGEKSASVLWIDAICINQVDETEKANQIPLLPRIFQRATCTLAYIKDTNHQNDAAMRTLLQIAVKAPRESSDGSAWPSNVPRIPSSWTTLPKPPQSDPAWTSIRAFFSSTFFRRVWIVQEIVISPNVDIICGKWAVPWKYVSVAVDVIMQSEPRPPESIVSSLTPFLALSNLREWEYRKYRWNLLALLDTFSYTTSTLARDRFFALLGLALDGNQDEFEPIYSKTVTFETIARRFGRAFVNQGRGMHLLYRAAGVSPQTAAPNAPSATHNQHQFPSWLPDFTTSQSNPLLASGDRGAHFDASKGVVASFPIRWLENDILLLAGYAVDKIARVSKACNREGPKQWGTYFREIDSMLKKCAGSRSQEEVKRLTMTVPVADAMLFGEVSIQEAYEGFRAGLRVCQYVKNTAKREKRWAAGEGEGVSTWWRNKKEEYVALLVDGLLGWRFFTTEKGRCGIAPGGAQVGDEVYVLCGGRVPFLLRRVAEGGFCLVGGCFVDGIMMGEALRGSGVGTVKTISIR